jgi:transposase
MRIIGIDLGKRESQFVETDGTGKEIGGGRFATDRDVFAQLFDAITPDGEVRQEHAARIIIESGTPSPWIAEQLRAVGNDVVVCDPTYLPTYGDRKSKRRKNDHIDALLLARALLTGNFRKAYERSRGEMIRKQEVDARARLVRSRSKHCTAIRSALHQLGLKVESCEPELLPSHLVKVLESVAGTPQEFALKMEREAVQDLNFRIALFDDRFASTAMSDERIARLMTLPGVGPVLATTFVAVVDEPDRFGDGHQLAAYLGLVPSERSSGDTIYKGRITKVGPAELRRLLVSAGWSIWRSKDSGLADMRHWAKRISKRSGMKAKGAVALARKLCGVLLAMTKKKETFRGAAVVVESSTETKPVKKPRNKLQDNATKSRRNLERAQKELAARTVVAGDKAGAVTATAAAPHVTCETAPPSTKTPVARPKPRPAAAGTAIRLSAGDAVAPPTAPAVDAIGQPSPSRTFVLTSPTTTPNEHSHVRPA